MLNPILSFSATRRMRSFRTLLIAGIWLLVMLGTAFAAYVISYKNYVKKHPVLLSSGGRSVTSDEDEDAGDDDADE